LTIADALKTVAKQTQIIRNELPPPVGGLTDHHAQDDRPMVVWRYQDIGEASPVQEVYYVFFAQPFLSEAPSFGNGPKLFSLFPSPVKGVKKSTGNDLRLLSGQLA
jgi:hypothetical protein